MFLPVRRRVELNRQPKRVSVGMEKDLCKMARKDELRLSVWGCLRGTCMLVV